MFWALWIQGREEEKKIERLKQSLLEGQKNFLFITMLLSTYIQSILKVIITKVIFIKIILITLIKLKNKICLKNDFLKQNLLKVKKLSFHNQHEALHL